jgi:transketolase
MRSCTLIGIKPRSIPITFAREGKQPGDYVQWNPMELLYAHDWNAIFVPDGLDYRQIIVAQNLANTLATGQPTGIVYRTVKGWHYGIEGKASHGAGHKFCSEAYYKFVREFEQRFKELRRFSGGNSGECRKSIL